MSEPKKSAAKSGDRRQPRLQDVQRLQTTVDELSGQVNILQAMVTAQAEADGTSPFKGLEFEEVCAGLAFAAVSLQGGPVLDYQVSQRVRHAMRGLKAVLTGDDSLLQDRPKARKKREPGAKLTHVQPSGNAEAGVTISGPATPARNPNA